MKHKTLAITEAGTLAPYLHDYFDLSQAHSVSLKDEFAHNHVQQFIDIAGVMFLLLNTKAEIKLINRKGCEILGYKQEEILGINWIDTFVPEEQRAATQNVFRQIMHKELESVEYHENPVVTKDGKIRIIAWHNTILCDEQDEIIGTLSSGEDITDRKKAEADLLKRDEKMHSLLQLAQSLQQDRSFDQVVQAPPGPFQLLEIVVVQNLVDLLRELGVDGGDDGFDGFDGVGGDQAGVGQGLEHVALGRVPEAVIDQLGIFRHQRVLEMRRLAVEGQRLHGPVSRQQDRAAGGLVDAARLHPDETVLDEIDAADPVIAAEAVEMGEQGRRAHRLAVDRHRVAMAEADLDEARLVRRVLRRDGALEDVGRRLGPGILEDLPFRG